MGRELSQVLCPECGTSGESDPQESRWQCGNCGNSFFLRRCSACTRVSYVDGLQGFHMPWPCTWCGQYNKGFSQNQDPATASAAELAAEVDRHGRHGRPTAPDAGGQDRPPGQQMTATLRSGQVIVRRIALFPLQVKAAPRSGWRATRRIAVPVVAVMACAATAFVLLTAGNPRAAGMPAAGTGPGTTIRVVQVTERASAVNLQGVPGRLVIDGTGIGAVRLTGQVRGTGTAPVAATRLDRPAGVLAVSIRCAPASQCTQNLRLVVPADTGIVVQQPGGQVAVAGLAGSLRLTGAHVNISASGLRTPTLTAAITHGHLSAAFTLAPRQVSITLTSAQAALRLPGHAAYRINQQVVSGYIRATIPQESSATRTVTARLRSSELDLLASAP
jgi:ribosomal protein S27AE